MTKYMMATKAYVGYISDSEKDNISRDEPDLCLVSAEDLHGNWVGHWVEGFGFTKVRFPKATTREVTKEEAAQYVGKRIRLAGQIRKAFTWEDFGMSGPTNPRIKISDQRWTMKKIGLLQGASSQVYAGDAVTGYSRDEYLEIGMGVYIENTDNWLLTSPVKSFWEVDGDNEGIDKIVLPSSMREAAHLDLPEIMSKDILFTTKTSLYMLRPWDIRPLPKRNPKKVPLFKDIFPMEAIQDSRAMMVACG